MVDFLRFFRKISCPNILESTAIKMEELRKQYSLAGLDESAVNPDPFVQFTHWFEEAQREITDSWFEVNAMALATADKHGTVSNRIVLLKGVDEIGFRFSQTTNRKKPNRSKPIPMHHCCFFGRKWSGKFEFQGRSIKRHSSFPRNTLNRVPLKAA